MVFAVFHRAAGLNGVVWITALVVGLTFWCVYQHSLNLSSMSLLAVAGTVLAAAASSLHWLARPHIFTIFLVTIWTAELEKMRLGSRCIPGRDNGMGHVLYRLAAGPKFSLGTD